MTNDAHERGVDRRANNTIPRRNFLIGLGAITGAAALAPSALANLNAPAGKNAAGIPLRILGRTKQKVTILGLGSAPVGHSKPGAQAGVPVYRAALEAGINYVDTAHIYDDAEAYLGELMPEFRDKIFLATKARPHFEHPKESAKDMERQFEQSLRLMKTDHVDLLHVHSVGDGAAASILAPGGPLDFVKRMKEKGLTRFIGISGHNRAANFVPIIETGEIDVIMVALNFVDYHQYRFEEEILPVARKHGCGILAMKVYGGHAGGFPGYKQRGPAKMPAEYLERSLRYSLDIEGVASAVVGVYGVEEVDQNVEFAKRYKPLNKKERLALRNAGKALAENWGPRFGPTT